MSITNNDYYKQKGVFGKTSTTAIFSKLFTLFFRSKVLEIFALYFEKKKYK